MTTNKTDEVPILAKFCSDVERLGEQRGERAFLPPITFNHGQLSFLEAIRITLMSHRSELWPMTNSTCREARQASPKCAASIMTGGFCSRRGEVGSGEALSVCHK